MTTEYHVVYKVNGKWTKTVDSWPLPFVLEELADIKSFDTITEAYLERTNKVSL